MNTITEDIYKNIEPFFAFDNQGWNGDSKIFNDLIEEIRPATIIEVGTWKGQSAINMGNSIKKLGLHTKIYCVDTWLGALEFWDSLKHTNGRDLKLKNGYPQIYYQFISNVVHSGLQDIIIPFPNTSLIAYRYFKSVSIKADLIYIDASHDEEDVYLDIKSYYDILNRGGIIFGDDYNFSWPGVISAVNRFSSENGLKLNILENNYWVIKNEI